MSKKIDLKQKKHGFTLAEGATHVDNSTNGFKKGFTLAEVLITLGIIGVVAAMTIPTLIANTNSSKFASQFKKSLSTLNQAALMATAQHDSDYGTLDNKKADGSTAATCASGESLVNGDSSICGLFNATLAGATYVGSISTLKANNKAYSPTFKSTTTGYSFASADDVVGYQLADNSLVVVPKAMAGCTKATDVTTDAFITANKGCVGYIDVNGPTLPNTEVSCGTGTTVTAPSFTPGTICTVGKDTKHMTDIYPIVFYDQTVEPATNASKAVLTGTTTSGS